MTAPNWFTDAVASAEERLALPIATYPGLALTGGTVRDIVTHPQAQIDVQAALHERYRTSFALAAMDLSAEAEAFGCELFLSDNEIPSVTGRLVTSIEGARRLVVPQPGDKRTGVYLEAVRGLKQLPSRPRVLAGSIGPFSLAARLVGVSEAMALTLTEPDLIHVLLEKSAAFLTEYGRAFKTAGADGLIMAEPAAGLLSPGGLASNSSVYIRHIAAALSDPGFVVILHNCAAKPLHLRAILETGLSAFHFGAPMDLGAALEKVGARTFLSASAPPATPGIASGGQECPRSDQSEPRPPGETVICGNLDPAGVFCQCSGLEIEEKVQGLLTTLRLYRNFVISSGCDIPPDAPLSSLDSFYAAVARQNKGT